MSTTIDDDTLYDLDLAVDAGAEFMDHIDPEWFWIVNPETLNMAGICTCVTAQHHPDRRVNFSGYFLTDTNRMDVLAFNISCTVGSDYIGQPRVRALTDLWREAIYDRRAAALEAVAS